jgi:pimeloyl-ACP methyl ester carboxylesterase
VRTFRRDGLTFDVTDSADQAGPVDEGTSGDPAMSGTVVLLHGFPQDRSAWDGVAGVLRAAGLRTLAPDQRGYSPGARPAGRSPYRLSEAVLDVVALLDAAGVRRAHVVGHDWGGAVGWALAAHHPERVASLTAVSTPHPRALADACTRSAQALRLWYVAAWQLPVLPELVLGRALERSLVASGLPADRARRYAGRMREPGALTAALGWYRALPTSLREPPPGAIPVPTTYVWGRTDVALGRTAAERTRGCVLAPYRFVELDAGHWLPETRAPQVAGVVLDRVRNAA